MGHLPRQAWELAIHHETSRRIVLSEAPLSGVTTLTQGDIVACSILSSLNSPEGEWWLRHFGDTSNPPYWVESRGEWAMYIDDWRSCKWLATKLGS